MEVEDWLGSENTIGIDIWKKKYQHENEDFEAWLDRVSGGDAEVRELIKAKKFLFGGRVLANRGVKNVKATLSNCYVIGLDDNIESIFKCAGEIARTYSYGGGCGINLSHLCPAGSVVNNSSQESSGALSFAELYDSTTAIIKQNKRNGALMLSMSSEHPDLPEFIDLKRNTDKITHANISVMASDAFMNAVINNQDYTLSFTRTNGTTVTKDVNAAEVFDKLVYNNWNYAEPGILYWDQMKQWSMVSNNPEFQLDTVNPCGELPLPSYGACCLGSFNLSEYLYWDEGYQNWRFDDLLFRHDIDIVVRAMNDVLDEGIPLHPLKEQQGTVAKWRQIGIGIMSWADVLIKMGIKYGSPESCSFANEVANVLINQAALASANLAKEYGPYPGFKAESLIDNSFMYENLSYRVREVVAQYGLRNATLLSIAPTGTLSTMIGCSGGLEPIFATGYNRTTKSLHGEDVTYKIFTPIIKELMKDFNIENEKDLPDYVVTSAQINPHDRVLMQAAWQRYIDSSISSTVNLPNSATVEDVKYIYLDAWRNGLKGITVYRSGCAREGILRTETKEQTDNKQVAEEEKLLNEFDKIMEKHFEEENVQTGITNVLPTYNNVQQDTLHRGDWKPLAEDTVYYKRKVYTGCANFALFIGWSESEQRLQDVYVKQSGKGGCRRSIDAIVITMSAILRLGGSLDNIAKAFTGLETCTSFARARVNGQKLSSGSSCADCILKTIMEFKEEMAPVQEITPIYKQPDTIVRIKNIMAKDAIDNFVKITKNVCPDCGTDLIHENGCVSCRGCGWSKCS